MYQLSQSHLLQLLYEKDCYIKALEQQLQISKQQIEILKSQKQSFAQNISSDEDCNLDENSEPAISDSRVEQFQSSGKKIKLKQPLQDSDSYNIASTRSSKYVQKKNFSSIDIQNMTVENPSPKCKTKLFDDFVIFGLENEQSKTPTVIYSYNSCCKHLYYLENSSNLMQIAKFIFPEGCKSKRIALQYSFEDINLIVNQNYATEEQNCFVILTKQMEQQQLKYYHCYRYSDFAIINKDQVHFSKRAICISSTKYMIDTFCSLIAHILNQMKFKRQESFARTRNISLIDTINFDSFLKTICSNLMNQLNGQNAICLKINEQQILLQEKENIQWVYIQIYQGIPLLFIRFNSQTLIKLFISCLIEKSIVFVSKSPQLITAACLLCQRYLLKPFTWIHPIISNLPLENILYLGSPVPIIAGIECNYQSLLNMGIVNKFKSTIFINLDSKQQVEFGNPDMIPLLSAELLTYLQGRLDEYFSRCQASSIHSDYLNCLQIFNQLFHHRVIRNIPTEPLIQLNPQQTKSQRKILDYQKIAEKTINNMGTMNADKFIWKQFFQTQVFIQFIDQYYH